MFRRRSAVARFRMAAKSQVLRHQNIVFPDDRVAVVVLVNQEAASTAGPIASGIPPLLFAANDATTAAKLEQAKKIFEGLQAGKD